MKMKKEEAIGEWCLFSLICDSMKIFELPLTRKFKMNNSLTIYLLSWFQFLSIEVWFKYLEKFM